jgi:flagellar FliL protein
MATKLDPPRGGSEAAKETDGAGPDAAKAPDAKASGGFKAWLPLVITVVTMPALAYATTVFVLVPKMQRALTHGDTGAAPQSASKEGAATGAEGAKAPGLGKIKIMVPLTKLLVNVAGTMGTRYLMTSVTLVGNTADFKTTVDDNKDQLMDLATGALSSKTISDLEKPGARNEIRAELMTVINNALGGPIVQEIYITEFAIQ